MAEMKLPSYCIVFDRAVKAVETEDGGMTVLVYDPEKDTFVREIGMLEYALGYSPEADIVSEEEFEAYVNMLRQRSRSRST
jgi:hypothetical protein